MKYISAVIIALNAASVSAQPTTSSPSTESLDSVWTFGGFADVGYLLNFNHPPNKLFRSRGTTWHTDHFHLNMFGAYARKKPSEKRRWGAELMVHTGKDDEVFGFSATAPNIVGNEWLRHLGLANVSYRAPIGGGLTLQGGIFPSLIGYDSLYAKDNLNYTRPWGADFTPYLMMGVSASYPFSNDLTATFYVVNGYWHLAHANNVPSSGIQLAYRATPAITVKQTLLAGPHQPNTAIEFWRFLSDTIVERRTERFIIAAEYHFSTERVDVTKRGDMSDPFRAWWMAAQINAQWTPHSRWRVTTRPEIAWDSDGRWTLAEQTVKALTITLDYRIRHRWTNTILRLEHRLDDSRGPLGGFFAKDEFNPSAVALKPRQQLLIFGLVFTFDAPEWR